MKLASLSDLRRALEARDRESVPCFRVLEFSNLPGFVDAKIELNATFLAICGGTGVGKTALLEVIYSALAALPEKDVLRPAQRLGSAEATLKVSYPGGEYNRTLKLNELEENWPGFATEVQIIGLGDRTSDLQSRFCGKDVDVDVLKEGVPSSEFTQEAREMVSMICQKNFTRVVVYETEGEEDRVAPLFEAETATGTYDSRTMASGELSVLYLAWAINRIPEQGIILIEEPEAYLPPGSHASVFGLICAATVRRRLGLVVTTHSAEIASQVAKTNLICVRTQAGLSLLPSSANAKHRVLSRLGLQPQRSAVLFVEDDAAKIVLGEILAMFDFAITSSVEIVTSNGAGRVRTTLRSLPKGIQSFSFLGILDGDMAAEAGGWDIKDSLLFLPFDVGIEQEFLDCIADRPESLGRTVNRTKAQVEEQLAHMPGHDPHDRFKHLADSLGVPLDAFTRASFNQWLKRPRKKTAAKRFAHALAKKLGVTLP